MRFSMRQWFLSHPGGTQRWCDDVLMRIINEGWPELGQEKVEADHLRPIGGRIRKIDRYTPIRKRRSTRRAPLQQQQQQQTPINTAATVPVVASVTAVAAVVNATTSPAPAPAPISDVTVPPTVSGIFTSASDSAALPIVQAQSSVSSIIATNIDDQDMFSDAIDTGYDQDDHVDDEPSSPLPAFVPAPLPASSYGMSIETDPSAYRYACEDSQLAVRDRIP